MNATLCILVCLAVMAASESSEENLEASRFTFPEYPGPDGRAFKRCVDNAKKA